MIEKITDALNNEYLKYNDGDWNSAIDRAISIVQEVAKEYKDEYEMGFEDGAESVRALVPYEDNLIPVDVAMPTEHDSIFAKYIGTKKWNEGMFEKISDTVNVTVIDDKGMAVTTYAHTVDGIWSCDLLRANKSYRIIAWQPLPAPYQKGE